MSNCSSVSITSESDVEELVSALSGRCAGIAVEATWTAKISLTKAFEIPGGSDLYLHGSAFETSSIEWSGNDSSGDPLLTVTNSSLWLEDIGFNGSPNGGVLGVGSNITAVDCSFANNSISGDGGAINLQGGLLNVTNCIFAGNQATKAGGALYTENTTTLISSCSFTDNKAETSGGAVHASHIDVQGSTSFIRNAVNTGGSGGAVSSVKNIAAPSVMIQ